MGKWPSVDLWGQLKAFHFDHGEHGVVNTSWYSDQRLHSWNTEQLKDGLEVKHTT